MYIFGNLSFLKRLFIVMAILMLPLCFNSAQCYAAAESKDVLTLKYGTAENEVMYYNSLIKGYEEIYPLGPLDFKIKDDLVFVLDTFNKTIKIFDNSSKLVEKIDVLSLVKAAAMTDEIYLSSFDVVKNKERSKKISERYDFFLADSINGKIYKISEGKFQSAISKFGDKPFELIQIQSVAVKNDKIFAGDYMNKKISVFDQTGAGVVEKVWNLGGYFLSNDCIYLMNSQEKGVFAITKENVEKTHSEFILKVQNPSWRIGKLIAVTNSGYFICAFFEDAVQPGLVEKNPDLSSAGFFTMAVIAPDSSIVESFNLPISVPTGVQFYFDEKSDILYYQNYNADTAPKSSYKISKIDFSFLKGIPADENKEIISLQKSVLEINYGKNEKQLFDSYQAQSMNLPILKCDKAGYFYMLDRAGKKIMVLDSSLKELNVINIEAGLKLRGTEEIKIRDYFAVSTSEIYLLDSENQNFYAMKKIEAANLSGTTGETQVKIELKKNNFSGYGLKSVSRIYSDGVGDIILYSDSYGTINYFDKDGKFKNTVSNNYAGSFFVMPNSDILGINQNEISGEVKISYYDFNFNSLNRFQAAPKYKTNSGALASGSFVIGADSFTNVFAVVNDGKNSKLVVFSVTGDKICDIDLAVSKMNGDLEKSVCVSPDGSLYFGVCRQDKYFVYKVTYATIINFIKADYLKNKVNK